MAICRKLGCSVRHRKWCHPRWAQQSSSTVVTVSVTAGRAGPAFRPPGHPALSSAMPLTQGVLSLFLSWMGLAEVLFVVAAGLGAVVAVWTARLLVRHAWYTHRLSCFSKPHAKSWLLGHLGQVGHAHSHQVFGFEVLTLFSFVLRDLT